MSWFQAPAVPFRVTADGAATTGAGVLKKFSIYGGTALCTVYDNASAASGTVLAEVTSAAAGVTVDFGPDGVKFDNGVYVDVGAGATAAIAYVTK